MQRLLLPLSTLSGWSGMLPDLDWEAGWWMSWWGCEGESPPGILHHQTNQILLQLLKIIVIQWIFRSEWCNLMSHYQWSARLSCEFESADDCDLTLPGEEWQCDGNGWSGVTVQTVHLYTRLYKCTQEEDGGHNWQKWSLLYTLIRPCGKLQILTFALFNLVQI